MDHFNWIPIAVAGLSALIWYLYSRGDKSYKVPYLNETSFNPVFRITKPMPQRKKQITDNMEMNKEQVVEQKTAAQATRDHLFSVLRKLNLDYKLNEDGDIIFQYQGENLQILASDDRKYILIRDLWWYSAPLDDIENLAILHRAVNECNFENASSILAYTQDTDENTINIHTFRTMFWIPEIPEIEVYFRATLDGVLHMHHRFYDKMESIRREKHVEANN